MGTIQSAIEQHLRVQHLSVTQFAELSSLNTGTLSNILNGHRSLSVGQLDRVTAAMGLPEGSFYDRYARECMLSAPDWRRFSPFLQRCAELGRTEFIGPVVKRMLEHLSYGPLLFEMAERFLADGRLEAAALLYQNVSESEKYQHSERLALCEYRLFQIEKRAEEDKDALLRAATKFEGYLERLEEADQVEGLLDLAEAYAGMEQWNRVEQLAGELEQKAAAQYRQLHNKTKKAKPSVRQEEKKHKLPSKPLFSCILQSYRLRAAALEELEQYAEALKYIGLCADAGWVKEADETTLALLKSFQDWANAETYACRMLAGEQSALIIYADCVTQAETDGRIAAVYRMVLAANRHGFELDNILSRFHPEIEAYAANLSRDAEPRGKPLPGELAVHFFAELAIYDLKKQRFPQAMVYLLHSLAAGVTSRHHAGVIRCVALFEQHREQAGPETVSVYRRLIAGMKSNS